MKIAQRKTALEAYDLLEKARDILVELATELRDEMADKSEKWTQSEKGQAAETEADTIEEAHANTEGAIETLSTIGDIFK